MKIINEIQEITKDLTEIPDFKKTLVFDKDNSITCRNSGSELIYFFELKSNNFDSKEATEIADFINGCEVHFINFIDEYNAMREHEEYYNVPDSYLEDSEDYYRDIGFKK